MARESSTLSIRTKSGTIRKERPAFHIYNRLELQVDDEAEEHVVGVHVDAETRHAGLAVLKFQAAEADSAETADKGEAVGEFHKETGTGGLPGRVPALQ